MQTKTNTPKARAASKSATVTVTIPARLMREMKARKVSPRKIMREVVSAMADDEYFGEILDDLARPTGHVCGVVVSW